MAALLVWVSHLAHGGDVAAPALTECSRPVILASSPVSKPSGSGALDVWSLVGGFVLVTVFAGMRRRQLFRDG